jgi:DNA-binding transcriptional regulator YdaS (Cro superfamily)
MVGEARRLATELVVMKASVNQLIFWGTAAERAAAEAVALVGRPASSAGTFPALIRVLSRMYHLAPEYCHDV